MDNLYLNIIDAISKVITCIFLGIGIWLTLRRMKQTDMQIKQIDDSNLQQRWNNALEQFGHSEPMVKAMGFEVLVSLVKQTKDKDLAQILVTAVCTYFKIKRPYPKKEGEHYPENLDYFEQQMLHKVFCDLLNEPAFKDQKFKIDLSNTDLRGADLMGAQLMGAYLMGAYLMGAYLMGANLMGANLERATLVRSNLESANLMAANLMDANLERATLVCSNLESANLMDANLERATLVRSNLESANLMCANLERATLVRSNLESADLMVAQLMGAYLMGAQLMFANLMFANLRGFNLTEATFSLTDLQGLDLTNTFPQDKIWILLKDQVSVKIKDARHYQFIQGETSITHQEAQAKFGFIDNTPRPDYDPSK